MSHTNKNKFLAMSALALFLCAGTYNAFIINTDSKISAEDAKYFKRLDEIYGVTTEGRGLAGEVHWKKLPKKIEVSNVEPEVLTAPEAPSVIAPQEEILPETNFSLVEVINQKRWEKGLPSSSFNGTLTTNAGIIENLNIALPDGESFSVSFAELTGNVFEYDFNGEIYSGLMYQADQNSYMVTLTNGPLEGTRFRFTSEAGLDSRNQELLAEKSIESGVFGEDKPEPSQELLVEESFENQNIQASGFNMEPVSL